MSYASRATANRHLPHSVYRLFDASGALLYVGLARDVALRIEMHLNPANPAWCATEVRERYAWHTSEVHSDWTAAHEAEAAAILAEAPELNRQHNRTKWRWDGTARTWIPAEQVSA